MLAYSSVVEFTPIYKQCKKEDCLECVELACRVNQGKVPYEKVEPLIKRFSDLKEESRISKNSPCHYGECEKCPDVSCGIWHGLAPEPVMPELLAAKWQEFWQECKGVLMPEDSSVNRSDILLQKAVQMLESWKREGILEEKLKSYGFDFLQIL